VWIEPGTFMMGSPPSEDGRGDDEDQHLVTLTKGYWLGKYPVTQRQWEAVLGGSPSHFKKGRVERHWFSPDLVDNEPKEFHPVECVTWYECNKYCAAMTEREQTARRIESGYKYALPTEMQWEYACRAGMSGPYGGAQTLYEMGWYEGNSGKRTHPVGQKKSNDWGLYDMHGNVREWCWDDTDIRCVATIGWDGWDTQRVVRGGSWSDSARECRSSYRSSRNPTSPYVDVGFRLALRAVQ